MPQNFSGIPHRSRWDPRELDDSQPPFVACCARSPAPKATEFSLSSHTDHGWIRRASTIAGPLPNPQRPRPRPEFHRIFLAPNTETGGISETSMTDPPFETHRVCASAPNATEFSLASHTDQGWIRRASTIEAHFRSPPRPHPRPEFHRIFLAPNTELGGISETSRKDSLSKPTEPAPAPRMPQNFLWHPTPIMVGSKGHQR
jgi:hypothetical protein